VIDFSTNGNDITTFIIKGGVLTDPSNPSAAVTPFESTSYIMLKKGKRYIIRDLFYDSGDYCTYANSEKKAKRTKICKEGIADTSYKCNDGECAALASDEKINDIDNGTYMLTKGGKEVMVKCIKNHCYKMSDPNIYNAYKYDNNGMYVFEDRADQDQALMNDKILDELTGILKKSLTLNQCVDGICTPTKGFIRFNNGYSIADYGINASATNTLTAFVECDGADTNEENKLKSNMDLCYNAATAASAESKPILGVGTLTRTGTINLYQRNTANVVGIVVSGNFITSDGFVVCTGYSCTNPGKDGYFINDDSNSKSENPLIFCSSSGAVCENKPKEVIANGYYYNDGSNKQNYIVCKDGECSVTTEDITVTNCGDSSGINKYKLVYESGFKYCKGGSNDDDVDLSTIRSSNYYLVENSFYPEKLFSYPDDMGTLDDATAIQRKVLIKAEKYSVTALTGDRIPIGYLKNADPTTGADKDETYIECKFTGDRRACDLATINTEADADCVSGGVNVGELYKPTGSKYYLCLDPSTTNKITIDLTTDAETNARKRAADGKIDSAGYYMLPLTSELFGVTTNSSSVPYFLAIEVDDYGNVKVIKEPKTVKYKYTSSDSISNLSDYEIISKSDAESQTGSGKICEASKIKAIEFAYLPWTLTSGLNPEVDYYVEGENGAQS